MKIQKYIFIQKFQDEKISEITDWTEEVYGDFIDIVCIIHNAMSTKDNLFRQLDYWIEKELRKHELYTREEYKIMKNYPELQNTYFGKSYEDHATKVIRALEDDLNITKLMDWFLDLGYLISESDGRPLTKSKAIDLFQYYVQGDISLSCLSSNINDRYFTTNKMDFKFLDDFETKEDIILWAKLYL